MKFTDGNWMMQPGIRAYYPAEAYDIEAGDSELTVYAPTKPIRHRGDTLDGPRWVRETHGFRSIPLLVRPNTLLAVGARDDRPDYAFVEGVTLRLYELADGAEAACAVPTPEGDAALSVAVHRTGRAIQASWTGAPTGWRLQLVGIASVRSADGAEVEADVEGPILRPMPGATSFSVEI
jgi:alpha-D-xyloside xylohydrolase